MENNIRVSLFLFFEVYVCLNAVTDIPNMCGENVCCAGFQLIHGSCIECPPGYHSINCTEICPDGFYGLLCKEKCPPQCNETCNKTSGSCPEGVDTDLKKKLIKFVEGNIWIVIGTSSIFVLCSCVWSVMFYKICTKDKERVIDHLADQNPLQSNFYENNEASIQHSASVQPPPSVHENNKPVPLEQVEYSKVKKRSSQIRKNVVSKEMTSHEDYSDESDDMFDSDEFEESNEICSKVQISDLPKTSQPEQRSMRRPNEAYGSIWL
nr:uncharacterized protein LOC105341439 isoform X1 [Crassostrea gigas]